MAAAQQAMQDQLEQMQAAQQDAAQVAAAQQAAQDAAQGAQEGMNGEQANQGQEGGQGQQPGQQPGQQAGQPGNGPGGQGRGAGERGVAEAPFTVKQEVSKSKDIEKGRVIAATLVKADAVKGESKAQVRDVAKAAMQESTDEIESERVGRQAQKVVRDYFGSMAEEK
jgi:hypothetical protein